MRESVVILCHTPNEIDFAIKYHKNHAKKNTVILTPNLESQFILKNNGIDYQSIYEVESFDKNNNSIPGRSIFKKTLQTITDVKKSADKLNVNIFGINIITLISSNLASIYPDIYHNYNTYKKILKKWKPSRIYLSSNIKEKYVTGNKDDFYSLSCYIKYYFKNKKIKIDTYYVNQNTPESKINLKKIISIFLLLSRKYYFQIINLFKPKYPNNKLNVLMETGGIITSYYYKLYELVRKQYNFSLITYKLQLHQQLPLIQKNIHFTQFESQWNDKFYNELENHKSYLIKKINKLSKINVSSSNDLNRAILSQTYLYLKNNLEQIIKKVIIQKQILKKYNPTFVINSHDPSITGASIVLLSKSLNLPTLLLLHGLYTGNYILDFHSQYFAIWGKQTEKYFSRFSSKSSPKLLSVGFPKFDEYNLKKKTKVSSKITIKQKLIIGFLLNSYSPNDSYQSKFLLELFDCLKMLDYPITLNYRFHESFNTQGINQVAHNFGIEIHDHSAWNLSKFINNSDLILSWDTSALLWVMVNQKPLIHTSPNWKKGVLFPTYIYKAAWCPENSKEFIKIVKRFIDKPECYQELLEGQLKLVKDVAGPLDGKSTHRLLMLINKLINIEKV